MAAENYLQQIMSEKRLSYRQLAKLSGVSFSALQKIANGERSPTQRTMIAIARALDLRVEEVFILKPKKEGKTMEDKLFFKVVCESLDVFGKEILVDQNCKDIDEVHNIVIEHPELMTQNMTLCRALHLRHGFYIQCQLKCKLKSK